MDINDLDGATTVGIPGTYPKDAGEFAARWNAKTPDQRQEFFEAIQRDVSTAHVCFMADHSTSNRMLQEDLALVEAKIIAIKRLLEV